MEIALIYARAANGVIGANGSMPWHLPEDLAHFKQLTLGCPVIMGRKTWDSLPPRFRPLPQRVNIVITRQTQWQVDGVQRAGSLAQALEWARQTGAKTAWIMGGAQIYAQALPLAARVEVTEIARDYAGDAYAPVLDAARETLIHSSGQAGFAVRDGMLGAKHSNSGAIASICNDTDRPNPQTPAARGMDQRFPKWQETARSEHVAACGLRYAFVTYRPYI